MTHTIPTGPVPTGTVSTGTVSTGTVSTGTVPTGTIPTGTVPTPVDPFAAAVAAPSHFLHHLNPLTKIAAVVPAMVLLVATRDLDTPLAFIALSYVLLLVGARLTRHTAALLFLAVPAGIAVLTVGFSIWIDDALVDGTAVMLRVGDWTLYQGAVAIGLATAVRLCAILALALVGGLTTNGPDLVRATVQQLRVPYRIGYTALAAYRFVPRFGYELSIIRAAHRVRGAGGRAGGRGPIARLVRGWGYIVPLLASGIRHAERVALSMDARAFGAHPTRTERHLVPWRVRDTVFLVAMLVVSAALFVITWP